MNEQLKKILDAGQISLDHTAYGEDGFMAGFSRRLSDCPLIPLETNDERIQHFIALTKYNRHLVNTANKEIQQFLGKIHPYIVPFNGSYVGLKTNNREIIGLDGKTVAEFPEAVKAQILRLEDNSFVALEKHGMDALSDEDSTRIISTGYKKYKPFSTCVYENLIPGKNEGEFHALMDDKSTVLTNLFDNTTTKYGTLPRFPACISTDNGHMIRIGDIFVTLARDEVTIIGTDNIKYGIFNEPVSPDTLIYFKNEFYAASGFVDEPGTTAKIKRICSATGHTPQFRHAPVRAIVQGIRYDIKKGGNPDTLDDVSRNLLIDVNKLERLLS
ncbi:MAG: hypothetical protein ACP5N3_01490 [Candidatus Nanoarchaeia archaeon]